MPVLGGTTILGGIFGSVNLAAFSAGTQSVRTGTIVLSNSNNVSFGLSASSILTASVSQSTQPAVNAAAGTQTATSGTVVFSNSNGMSFGMSASSVITASYTQSTAPSAIAAGTQTATSGTVVFSNSNGVTFGMSGNSRITASFTAPVASGLSWPQVPIGSFGSSDGALSLARINIPFNMTVTRLMMLGAMSIGGGTSSNATGGLNLSVGLYTMSGSTASLASSGSRFYSFTSAAVSNGVVNATGTQYRSIGIGTWNITPGDYLFAFHGRSIASAGSWTWWGNSQSVSILTNFDSNSAPLFMHGFSSSSFSTAMPASINVTDTNYVRSDGSALRQPGFMLFG